MCNLGFQFFIHKKYSYPYSLFVFAELALSDRDPGFSALDPAEGLQD
jgi:hypothetical protein